MSQIFSLLSVSSWLDFLTWRRCGPFLNFVTVLFHLSLLVVFPHLSVSIFQGLASCLYLFSPKNMLLRTFQYERTTSPPHSCLHAVTPQLTLYCKSFLYLQQTPGHVLEAMLSPREGALHYLPKWPFMSVRTYLTAFSFLILVVFAVCFLSL